jgi:divalent metal cation (Fe/Co/Zn/Cd) transporter
MSPAEHSPTQEIRTTDVDECADGCCSPPATVERDAGWHRTAGRVRLLSWLSLAYMAAEGAVAITAAVLAGSVALLGFGLDSVIEGLASVIVIWRFTGTRTLSETSEARAQKAVAVTFFLLAPYIAYDAVTTLISAEHATTSWLGIGLSIASLIVMPLLGVAKKRLGTRLESGATSGEGTQNLLCAYLAAAVLLGLLANTVLGWWWLDPVVGLGIAALAVREGIDAWRGDDCC